MVFTLKVCVLKNGMQKIKEKRKLKRYVWIDLKTFDKRKQNGSGSDVCITFIQVLCSSHDINVQTLIFGSPNHTHILYTYVQPFHKTETFEANIFTRSKSSFCFSTKMSWNCMSIAFQHKLHNGISLSIQFHSWNNIKFMLNCRKAVVDESVTSKNILEGTSFAYLGPNSYSPLNGPFNMWRPANTFSTGRAPSVQSVTDGSFIQRLSWLVTGNNFMSKSSN